MGSDTTGRPANLLRLASSVPIGKTKMDRPATAGARTVSVVEDGVHRDSGSPGTIPSVQMVDLRAPKLAG
jgi:hypothetical protein